MGLFGTVEAYKKKCSRLGWPSPCDPRQMPTQPLSMTVLHLIEKPSNTKAETDNVIFSGSGSMEEY